MQEFLIWLSLITGDFEHLFRVHTDSLCLLFCQLKNRVISSWLTLVSVPVRSAVSGTLCNPEDCSPPGSLVHGILQARILGWVAISFFGVFSWPRDWTRVSCLGRQILYLWATEEARWLIIRVTCIFWIWALCQMCFAKISQTVDFLWASFPVFWRGNILNPDDVDFHKIRKKWLCPPILGDGQGSLACCSPWGHKESDMTERLNWTELPEL